MISWQAAGKHNQGIRLLIPTLILLVAAGLRIGLIRAYGLVPDEAVLLEAIHRPFADLAGSFLNVAADPNPQLYPLLLKIWTALAGTHELSLRLPNIAADLLAGAALVWGLRSRAGIRASLLGGALWAVAPLPVWLTQVVYSYSILTLLATLTWLFLLRALNATRPVRWWLVFGAAAVLTGYMHVLGMVALAGAAAVIYGAAIFQRRLAGIPVLLAVQLICLPYFLQLLVSLTAAQPGSTIPVAGESPFLARMLWLALLNRADTPGVIISGLVLVCMGASLLAARRKSRGWAVWPVVILGVVTLATIYLHSSRGVFEARYLALMIPPVVILVAGGIARLPGMLVRGAALAGLIAVCGLSLFNQAVAPLPNNFPTASQRDDMRSAAEFLEQHADGGDVIVVMSDYARPLLDTYYDGPAEVIAPYSAIRADTPLDDMEDRLGGHDTAWLALYAASVADPDNRLDGWFRSQYPMRTEVFPVGVTVRGYDMRPLTDSLPPEATRLDAEFSGQIALRGYQLYVDRLAASDSRLHPPSGWVHVTLYWEAIQPGAAFEPRVQMEDDLSRVWGLNFVRGSETYFLSPIWDPGFIWRTDLDVNLNPVTPPGVYHIVLRVFAPGGDEAWAITAGESVGASTVILGDVEIISGR